MMHKLVAILGAIVLSSVAFADMKTLDADGSGTISQEEAQANPAVAEQFTVLDANGDGQVDEAEFAAFEAPAAEGEAAE